MNKKQRSLLYGMCLGDGCLSKQKGNANYGLSLGHGPSQKPWLEFKAGILHSIFGGKPLNINSYRVLNKRTQKIYENLQTKKTHPYFNQMHKNLYPSGSKTFSRKVLDFLDDEGFAFWFMDDGSGGINTNRYKNPCGCNIRIATYFSLEEALIVKDWFWDKYKVIAKFDIDKRSNRVSLRFGTLDSKKLAEILKPYIIPSLFYKIQSVLSYSPRVLGPANAGEDIV